MRVLVCGGRDFDDIVVVGMALHRVRPSLIIEGGASGADACARTWARSNGVPCETVPAQWQKYGKRAGPLRNQRMIDECQPDLVLAFPGGRGTADLVARARRANVAVTEVPRE